ncbi:Thiol:disulfide interchange protein DsbD [Rhodobacteraceae bacterium IMCC1933]|nr:Thiol:disulfide interchange protein DsbD [Rhodobacteraceae bacterium IMCC1923]MDP4068513.1 Thiol:disulfide interchange protein DsbD [Rhodobacteraceae bacterium IMCC1933]MDP4070348.1 Thiol:disulfide interchange protein DsbD [Rhodobacteraceae bacterium IMCC1909]
MLGIDLWDAGLMPAMFVALLSGLMSFASPCVLPIVPPYLAYMGGVSMDDMSATAQARRRVVLAALFFVLGLSTVFILLGFTASSFGRLFLSNQDWFVSGAGILVMVFGAHFLGVIRIGILDREARIEGGDRGGSAFGAYILGLAFAFGWTPCLGPILGTILALAADTANPAKGVILLATYAAGLGIPFVLVAVFFPSLKGLMDWMKRHMMRIERIMGLLLWTVGLIMVTGQFTQFSWWILEQFPTLSTLG